MLRPRRPPNPRQNSRLGEVMSKRLWASRGSNCRARQLETEPRWRRGVLFVAAVTAATDRGKVSAQLAWLVAITVNLAPLATAGLFSSAISLAPICAYIPSHDRPSVSRCREGG